MNFGELGHDAVKGDEVWKAAAGCGDGRITFGTLTMDDVGAYFAQKFADSEGGTGVECAETAPWGKFEGVEKNVGGEFLWIGGDLARGGDDVDFAVGELSETIEEGLWRRAEDRSEKFELAEFVAVVRNNEGDFHARRARRRS